MRETLKRGVWLRHLAVAALYFGGYLALRHVAFAFWLLPAGLRLFCLLVTPYRYWPALAIGEMLSVGKETYTCYEVFGPIYAALRLLPSSAIAMPFVYWCRKRLSIVGPGRQIQINALVFCTFVVSVLLAGYNYFRYWISPLPHGAQPITIDWLPRYFLGQYLGVLSVTPLALLLWQQARTHDWRSFLGQLSKSRLVIDSLTILLPSLALLAWVAVHAKGDVGMGARMAMFLPVTALALRHGWQGAAIGGTAASSAIAMVMPVLYDADTMQAEVFVAFTITVLLILGARIASLNYREQKERADGQLALQDAQLLLYQGELRMQHAAETLQQITSGFHKAHDRMVDRVKGFMTEGEERRYSKPAIAQLDSSNVLYHRAWQDNGLAATLRQGSIAHALESLGITYACGFKGTGLEDSSPGFQLALYRLACEAVVYIHETASPSYVRLQLRSTMRAGRCSAALQITGTALTSAGAASPQECTRIREQLGALANGIDGIRQNARIYSGTVRARQIDLGTRLSLVIHDGAAQSGRTH